MPSTACLVPAYAPIKGKAILPPVEPTLRILPGSSTRGLLMPNNGKKACVTEIKPTTLTSKCVLTSPSGCSASGPPIAVPALLTRPASPDPPSASPTSSAARSHRLRIGHVEDERDEARAKLRREPLRVLLFAHAPENAVAAAARTPSAAP